MNVEKLSSYCIVIILFSCSKPESCFEIAEKQFVNEQIIFSNCSSNSKKSTWSYGDGLSDKLGCHTYTKPGVYEVELESKNGKRNDVFSTQIQVGYYKIDSLTYNIVIDNCKDGAFEPDFGSIKLTNVSTNFEIPYAFSNWSYIRDYKLTPNQIISGNLIIEENKRYCGLEVSDSPGFYQITDTMKDTILISSSSPNIIIESFNNGVFSYYISMHFTTN